MSDRGWVGVVANAAAGIGRGRDRVRRLVEALRGGGLEPEVGWTPEARSALVERSRADPSGCRGLVAVGGDGTVAALINERPAVPITVMPSGTENLFARHFGLSTRPEIVAATVAVGRTRTIDLGRAGGRRFALMAGLGFDADVVTRHHAARLGRAGRIRPTHRVAYVEPVLRSSLGYTFPPLTVTIADAGREETLVGTTAFVFNLPRYALGLPFAPEAREDDGRLDLVLFRDAGALRALHYLWTVLRGAHLNRPDVYHRQVRGLTVSCEVEVPVQLDGDPGGTVAAAASGPPWSAEILPAALEVIVPPTESAAGD